MRSSTLASLSYGLARPADLLVKLKADGSRLSADPHPHDVFNFIITSAVLNEWTRKVHGSIEEVKQFADSLERQSWELLPPQTNTWIADRTSIILTGPDVRYHVLNILQLSWHTANASKHFYWTKASGVTDIQSQPIVRNWYQFFFTSRTPGLYVEYEGHTYGLIEVRSVLEQFFSGLLEQVDNVGGSPHARGDA